MKKRIMVSACLLGSNCRYDGSAKFYPEITGILANFEVTPFCPELLGGLVAPRPPAEINGGDGTAVLESQARVVNSVGENVTANFLKGATECLDLANQVKPELIVLKANSPSCGVGRIYDGSFQGRLRDGDGVTTALLRLSGFKVCSEPDLLVVLAQILGQNND